MTQSPLVFHIDVNSAFLSWESVCRLAEDPKALDLRTIPSAVGGDAASRHGIVLAKSCLLYTSLWIFHNPRPAVPRTCQHYFTIFLYFRRNTQVLIV